MTLLLVVRHQDPAAFYVSRCQERGVRLNYMPFARMLGVSNVTVEQLQTLCQKARTQPQFVQNRCYAVRGWDRRVRQFCVANDVVYQGFSLLTANQLVMARPELTRIAKRHGRTVSQIVFRFALDIGILPLTGTTSPNHMRADLEIFDFRLESGEVELIEGLGAS